MAAAGGSGPSPAEAYQSEMAELKALMHKSLEQKGVLAKIKAEIRASIFQTLEESDRAAGPSEPTALLGTCSEQAAALNGTKAGRLLGSLICEYMEWAGIDHSLKLFLAETNLQDVYPTRRASLAQELGLPASSTGKPLLLELLEQHFHHKTREAQQAHAAASASTGTSSAIAHARGMARASSPTRGPTTRSSSPFSRGLSPFSRGDRDKQKAKAAPRDERSSSGTPASLLRDH